MDRTGAITGFTEAVWHWYAQNKRDLPWRDLNVRSMKEHGYRILVSEIMLQQTQVSRVKIVYKNFLQTFPRMEDLAAAGNREVILAWRGMGYNNRALRLRDAVRLLAEKREFPSGLEELQALPGIGHYTAAAVRNFAFNIPTPCLDTNIRRILHRAFVGPERADGTWRKEDDWLLGLAGEVLSVAVDPARPVAEDSGIPRDTRNWHAALMDFGSLVCMKRNPDWESCPLTAVGLMKAAYKVPGLKKNAEQREPGRMIGTAFVPNRIIRGRVVEELRDAPGGLSLTDIGSRVCIDWSRREHEVWLKKIIAGLSRDAIVRTAGTRVMLRD